MELLNEIESKKEWMGESEDEVKGLSPELRSQLENEVTLDLKYDYRDAMSHTRDERAKFAKMYSVVAEAIYKNYGDLRHPGRRDPSVFTEEELDNMKVLAKYMCDNVSLYMMCYEDLEVLNEILKYPNHSSFDFKITTDRDDLVISVDPNWTSSDSDLRLKYYDEKSWEYKTLSFWNLEELLTGGESIYDITYNASRILENTIPYEDYANLMSDALQEAFENFGIQCQQCYEGVVEDLYVIGFDAFIGKKGSFITANVGLGAFIDRITFNIIDKDDFKGAHEIHQYGRGPGYDPTSFEPMHVKGKDSGRYDYLATLYTGWGVFYNAIKDFRYGNNIRLD